MVETAYLRSDKRTTLLKNNNQNQPSEFLNLPLYLELNAVLVTRNSVHHYLIVKRLQSFD